MTQRSLRQTIVKRERLFKLFIVGAIISLSLAVLLVVPYMMVSFLVAFVIHYMFKPIVNSLERAGIGKTLAVLIPFLFAGGILVASFVGLGPRFTHQMTTLEQDFPKYVSAVTTLVDDVTKKFSKPLSKISSVDLTARANEIIQEQATNLFGVVPKLLSGLLTVIALAPLLAFFMLRDGREFSHQLLAVVPNNLFELSMNLLYQISKQLGDFIRARLLESVIVGAVVWIGLLVLGFPYALILGIVAGVTNLVPYLGPVLGAVPGLVICLVNPEYSMLMVFFIYALAQIVDMIFIIPLVVAKIVNLHPATVILCLVVGGYLMGILGMIISVPVTSIVKLTFTEFYKSVVDFRG